MRRKRSLSSRRHRLSYALIAALFLSNAPAVQSSYAQGASLMRIIERPDEDLQIFSLDIGKRRLIEALLVYEDLDTGRYYVPLVDIVDALEFPIDVDEDQGIAQGWFMSEDRTFLLDIKQGRSQSGGVSFELSADDIERHADGLYVSLNILEKWFPVTLDVDFSELRLVLSSLEPLPLELRLERQKKRDRIAKAQKRGPKKYPLDDVSTPLFTIPIVDVNAQAILDNSDAAVSRIVESSTILASSVFAGQDLHVSVNDATANGQPPDIRAEIGYIDLNSDLLGVGGTEYKAGDIYSTSLPYIASSASGRGAYFSTFPVGYDDAGQSGQKRLRGELPVGYQVDVMRNGQLIAFQSEPNDDGEYDFSLDVLPGLNVFELIFYGPQGQKDTKEERVFVPVNAARKGEFDIELSLLEGGRNLITNHSGANGNLDWGRLRSTVRARYGLSEDASVYAALADVTIDGDRERFGVMRFSKSFKSVRTDWTYARNFRSSSVLGIRMQSVFKGISWQFEHSGFRNNFNSEETQDAPISGTLKHDTELRLSGVMPLFNNVPFTFNLQRLSNTTGLQRVAWDLRATKSVSKIRVTADISQVFEEGKERETDLSMRVNSRIDKLNLRGGVNFDLEPQYNLRNLSLLADWKVGNKGALRFGVERTGIDADIVHAFTLGGSYDFDPMKLGLSVRYNDENDLRAVLSSSFSLGYNPLNSGVHIDAQRLTDTATIVPRVFFDENNNSIFDAGEEPVKGVGFDGRGIDRKARTNENGELMLSGIDRYERITLNMDAGTLSDPFLIPGQQPRDYILRAGQVVRKDIPVIMVGEVDGEVFIAKHGKATPAQSFLVNLTSTRDPNTSYQSKTEYDGFIWMQKIAMGSYKARIDQQQLDDLGYCSAGQDVVTLNSEEIMASLKTFTIWPKLRDNVIVNLGRGSVDALKRRWLEMSEDLKGVFYDLDTYPASYILKGESDQDATLALYAVDEGVAKKACIALSEKGIFCEVWRMEEEYCPKGFVAIDQISARDLIDDEFAQEGVIDDEKVYIEDIDERNLVDMTEEDVRKVIDNSQ